MINIHSVTAAALLRLVARAVHLTLRFLRNFPGSVVSAPAALRELNPGIFVVVLKTRLLTTFYGVRG